MQVADQAVPEITAQTMSACSALIRDVGLANFKRAVGAFVRLTWKDKQRLAEFERQLVGAGCEDATVTLLEKNGFKHLLAPLYKTPRSVKHRHEKIEFLTMVATWKPAAPKTTNLPSLGG